MPEDLAGSATQLFMVESSVFGAYDTATRTAELAPGDAWAPVVTHAMEQALAQIAEARAAAAAAEQVRTVSFALSLSSKFYVN